MKPVFLIALVAVAMVGVMVPSSFAQLTSYEIAERAAAERDAAKDAVQKAIEDQRKYFEKDLKRPATFSSEGSMIWTDKVAYHKGDTVTITGIYVGNLSDAWELKIRLGLEGEMGYKLGSGKMLDISPIVIPDENGYFSHTFQLAGDYYPLDSEFVENESYHTYSNPTAKNFLTYDISIGKEHSERGFFTSSSTEFFVNPSKLDMSNYSFKIINFPDSGLPMKYSFDDGIDSTVSTENPLSCGLQLITPSGLIFNHLSYACNGGQFKIPNSGGYGIYEIKAFVGDNTFSKKFEIPRWESSIEINANTGTFIRHQPIHINFVVQSANPNIQYVDYKIIDPSGNQILSEKAKFTYIKSADRDFLPFLNSHHLSWYTEQVSQSPPNDFLDTSTFPLISGTYTIEANYDGIVKTKSFNFDSESKKILIDNIKSEFMGTIDSLRNTQDYVDVFGEERTKKYFEARDDYESRVIEKEFLIQFVTDLDQYYDQKLNEGLNSAESKIVALDISLDEQTELIFELREKAKAREDSINRQTVSSIKIINDNAERYIQTAQIQEQYASEQELLEKQLQSELDQIKDEIKSKIESTSKIASFVDQTKDPQHYIDRYNNEPAYKEWFDENYPQYSSIYDAVGMEKTAVEPILEPIVEPIVEYSPEPIAEVTSMPNCGTGTEEVNGICQVIKNNDQLQNNELDNLKKILPDYYNVQDIGTGVDDTNGLISAIATIQTDNGGVGSVNLLKFNDEDVTWNFYKKIKMELKYSEDVENSSATCFEGWSSDNEKTMGCIKDNLLIMVTTNYDETELVMTQILDKMDNSSSNTNNSNGGGCLIATAIYGSEMSNEVQQLRELRDNQLLNTASGTQFMSTFNDIYYSFSPTIADMERENPYFKEAVKLAITPMISSLSLMENAESESEVFRYWNFRNYVKPWNVSWYSSYCNCWN